MTVEILGFRVRWPIIGAPMGAGPSTPALAAAVSDAGGLGFLAGAYLDAETLHRDIDEIRHSTSSPFGVNLFVPGRPTADRESLDAYLASLRPEAQALGVDVAPSWDDDGWPGKLELLMGQSVPVVSFTFGCPPPEAVRQLRDAGSRIVITVTTPEEAVLAAAAGADAVCAQGIEAGGHQGSFGDATAPDSGWGLLALLSGIQAAVDVPIIAAGGLMTGADVAAVIRAGAVAAQLGTALIRCPESGATELYKAALADPSFTGTAITRAFSGRRARGLVNDFMRAHPDAPSAYPEINNATRALRRAAVARGNPHGTNLWAGQGYRQAQARPAAEVVTTIGAESDRLLAGPRG
jgi:nitronate monooxygenase